MTLDKVLELAEANIVGPYCFTITTYRNKHGSVKVRIKILHSEKGISLDSIEPVLDLFKIIPLEVDGWEYIQKDRSIRAVIPSDFTRRFFYTHYHD